MVQHWLQHTFTVSNKLGLVWQCKAVFGCQLLLTGQNFSVASSMLKQAPGSLPVVAVNAVVLAAGTGENQVLKVWFEACQNNGCLINKANVGQRYYYICTA
jgi:hypothetical protein